MFAREDKELFVDEMLCRFAFLLVHVEENARKQTYLVEASALMDNWYSSGNDPCALATADAYLRAFSDISPNLKL